jgi:hypothetical protein
MKEISYKLDRDGDIFFKGQKFPTNRFVGNFLQHRYKNDTCPLNM